MLISNRGRDPRRLIRRPGADHVAIWIQIASSLDRAHAAEPPPALRTTSRVAVGDKGEIKRKFSFVISTAMRLRVYIYIYSPALPNPSAAENHRLHASSTTAVYRGWNWECYCAIRTRNNFQLSRLILPSRLAKYVTRVPVYVSTARKIRE